MLRRSEDSRPIVLRRGIVLTHEKGYFLRSLSQPQAGSSDEGNIHFSILLQDNPLHGFLQFSGMSQEFLYAHLLEEEQTVRGSYAWALMLVEVVFAQ